MAGDRYEEQYMDGASATYHEKHVARVFVGIFLAIALVVLGFGVFAVASGAPLVAAAFSLVPAAIIAFVALYFAVMRVTVTETELAVAYGTLSTRVPLAAVTSLGVERRIGLGPKYDGRGWNYGAPWTSRGVRLEWTEGAKTKTCYVGSRDPEALLAAIQRGRGGVRVDVASRAGADVDAVARAEAEAEAEAASSAERAARS